MRQRVERAAGNVAIRKMEEIEKGRKPRVDGEWRDGNGGTTSGPMMATQVGRVTGG